MINIWSEGLFDITWNDMYQHILYTRGGPHWQVAKVNAKQLSEKIDRMFVHFIFLCRFHFRNFSSQAKDASKTNNVNCSVHVYHVLVSQRPVSSIWMVHLIWKLIILDLNTIQVIPKNLHTKCIKCRNLLSEMDRKKKN